MSIRISSTSSGAGAGSGSSSFRDSQISSLSGSSTNLSLRLEWNDITICGRQKEIDQLDTIFHTVCGDDNNKNGGVGGDSPNATSTSNGTMTAEGGTSTARPLPPPTSSSSPPQRALVVITGPTGIGKTSLIIDRQEAWKAECLAKVAQQGGGDGDGDFLYAQGSFQRSSSTDSSTSATSSSSSASSKPAYLIILDTIQELIRQWTETTNFRSELKEFTHQILKDGNADTSSNTMSLLKQTIPDVCSLIGCTYNNKNKSKNKQKMMMMMKQNQQKEEKEEKEEEKVPESGASSTTTPSPTAPTTLSETESAACGFAAMKHLLQQLLVFLSNGSRKTTSTHHRKMVLFFDNFQSACSMSMELLQFVADCTDLKGLLLIVAYREEEVPNDHWVSKGLHKLQQGAGGSGCPVHYISLGPLDIPSITNMVNQITGHTKSEYDDTTNATSSSTSRTSTIITSTTTVLSDIILSKTGGNPFYIIQFLQHCYEQKYLTFNILNYQWEWNVSNDGIIALQNSIKVSENVAQLAISSLQQLPIEVQQLLIICSCLGDIIPKIVVERFFHEWNEQTTMVNKKEKNEESKTQQREEKEENNNDDDYKDFNIEKLSFLLPPLDPKRVTKYLEYAVKGGILNRSSSSSSSSSSSTTSMYQWSHDALQKATYSLLANPTSANGLGCDRQALHFRLGKCLYRLSQEQETEITETSTATTNSDWMIFLAADQFNAGFNLCKSNHPIYLDELAQLNLEAAQLSMSRGAFFPARAMLRNAAQRLDPTKRWTMNIVTDRRAEKAKITSTSNATMKPPPPPRTYYELSLDIYSLLAEVESITGHNEDAMDAALQVLDHATSLEDKFRAQHVWLKQLDSGPSRDFETGIQGTLKILKEYGEPTIDRHPFSATVLLQRRKLKQVLPNVEALFEKPEMTDPRALRVSSFLLILVKQAGIAANADSKNDWSFTRLSVTRLMLMYQEYGVSPHTCIALLNSATMYKMEGKLNKAMEYADFALKMCTRYPEQAGGVHSKVKLLYHAAIFPTLRPFHKCLEQFLDTNRIAIRTGDLLIASSASMCYGMTYFCLGLTLAPLESDLMHFGQEAVQFGIGPGMVAIMQIMQQTILNLQGCDNNYNIANNRFTNDPTVLKGRVFDQDAVLATMDGQVKAMTLRDLRSFQLMLTCIYGDFTKARILVDQLMVYSLKDILEPRKHIRLTYLGLAAFAVARERGWHAKCKYLRLGRKILKRFQVETECGSVNSHPILQMLQAEEHPSKELYEKAIKSTGRSGLVHHQAYMYERAAHFLHRIKGEEGAAEFYYGQACQLYADWGAFGKVEQLQGVHEFLHQQSKGRMSSGTASSSRSNYSHVSTSMQGRTRHEKGLTEAMMRFSIEDTQTPTGSN